MTIVIALTGTPSSSATTCMNAVSEPVPMSTWPVKTVTVLSGWIAIHESSWPKSITGYAPPSAKRLEAARATAASEPARLKPTISPPPPFTNDRRESSLSAVRDAMSLPSRRHHGGCLLDRLDDPRLRAAPAEVPVHGDLDLARRRPPGRAQQVGRLDHHSILAIAALGHLHVDPRLLQGVQRR